jgi:hypothetical protein
LGAAKIPLLDLITSTSGINNEIPIFSQESIFVGSIKTRLQYDEQNNFQTSNKSPANLIISITNLINHVLDKRSFTKENNFK